MCECLEARKSTAALRDGKKWSVAGGWRVGGQGREEEVAQGGRAGISQGL